MLNYFWLNAIGPSTHFVLPAGQGRWPGGLVAPLGIIADFKRITTCLAANAHLMLAPGLQPQKRDTTGYPECQKNLDIFETVESAVKLHISRNRDVSSPDIDGADEIRTFLDWCEKCFMKTECLTDMIRAKYTGIAGGQFLHEGVAR